MNFKQKTAAVAATVGSALLAAPAFAAGGPSAGDLSNLTPDNATLLTAVGAVAVVMLGVALAIKGYRIVKSVMR